MKLSAKAQAALDAVVEKFKQGDLSPVVEIARLQRQPGDHYPADDWSLCNRVMAYVQTGSLDCRGYRQWQQVGRQVKKGSHAAYILAPLHVTVQDPDADEPRQRLRGFKSIPVFAYHDTEGEPLPEFDYSPRDLPPLVDVAQRLGVEVTWQPLPPDLPALSLSKGLGGCSVDGSRIRLASHDAAVFFHELAHAAHARLNGGQLKGGQHTGQETVAEFTAAVLMQLYGLGDRSGNAWRYIQGFTCGDDDSKNPLKAIVKALSTVEKVLQLLEIT